MAEQDEALRQLRQTNEEALQLLNERTDEVVSLREQVVLAEAEIARLKEMVIGLDQGGREVTVRAEFVVRHTAEGDACTLIITAPSADEQKIGEAAAMIMSLGFYLSPASSETPAVPLDPPV